jgi:hypothetical protein
LEFRDDVLEGQSDQAHKWLERALASVREQWEPVTTAGNLSYIHEARLARGQDNR